MAGGIAQAAVDNTGGTAYIVDDRRVADNDATGRRSAIGTLADVDSDGV